jgi:CO/xanthine dehydrogenase Mo-binding subunit
MTTPLRTAVAGGVGESPVRPDGVQKTRGEFAYSSDLWAKGMLWGATLRSPHPYARIRGVDVSAAVALAGVTAATALRAAAPATRGETMIAASPLRTTVAAGVGPHPDARIRGVDVSAAVALGGVTAATVLGAAAWQLAEDR